MIKDTAASFEGTCSARGITFDLTFSAQKEMVFADLGKIQQVLYNLIDNAIKFSHDNSVIYIQESVRHEKVFISVKDTGIGIPKENQKKIWERFYKSDPSRGKDKKGTGLGLSIVKEIIQAHGENIDVISTEGNGIYLPPAEGDKPVITTAYHNDPASASRRSSAGTRKFSYAGVFTAFIFLDLYRLSIYNDFIIYR